MEKKLKNSTGANECLGRKLPALRVVKGGAMIEDINAGRESELAKSALWQWGLGCLVTNKVCSGGEENKAN